MYPFFACGLLTEEYIVFLNKYKDDMDDENKAAKRHKAIS